MLFKWWRAFTPTGPTPTARPSCTSSPAAATASAWCKRGLPVDRWIDLFGDWLANLEMG